MKNTNNLLKKTNLRPKERVLLLVANTVNEETTGKSILTEAEKLAISEGWKPANNDEVSEYNRYNEGWRFTGFAELDAQTTYLTATNSLLRAGRLIDLIMPKEKGDTNELDYLKKHFFNFYKGEANPLEFILQNSGLELDYTVYRFAFESLSEDLKQDLEALDPDGKTETQYLDQEEILADLFNGKDKLTKESKEKLADLIVKSFYNKYADFLKKLDAKKDIEEYYYNGFFGELPALDILKKWADNNKISYEVSDKDLEEAEKKQKQARNANELIGGDKGLDKMIRKDKLKDEILIKKLKDYAETHKVSIGDLLKQTLLKWLDEGLFTEDYTPIFNSDNKNTCNNTDTKLPHKEVFKEWLKAKRKAEQTIKELIDKGELKVAERTRTYKNLYKEVFKGKDLDFSETLLLITGESLYNLKGDYIFAKDFKKQVEDLEGLGGLILFLRECKFIKEYATLLEFLEIFKRLSKIYDIDLTYKIKDWIADFKRDIDMLNSEIRIIGDDITLASFKKHNISFLNTTLLEDLLIDLDKIEPSKSQERSGLRMAGIDRYYEEFKKIFKEPF